MALSNKVTNTQDKTNQCDGEDEPELDYVEWTSSFNSEPDRIDITETFQNTNELT